MITRNGARRLTEFYPATKGERSPTKSKTKKSAVEVEKKENTPTKKARIQEISEKKCHTPEAVVRAKRSLGLGQTEYKIIGRETEINQLTSFVRENVEDKRPASIYVSGLPGTGKTMCVKRIVDDLKIELKFCLVWINCMNVETVSDFYNRISSAMDVKKKIGKRKISELSNLENYLTTGSKMTVICLDEIDQLQQKFPAALTRVFEWPSLRGSNVVLIGIANSFDLTDRYLKKMDLKTEIKPKLLHFRPYKPEEVAAIVTERLSGYSDLIQPQALELCARKCAAIAGDVRKALETCKIAVERAAYRRLDETQPVEPTGCNSSEVLAALQDVYAPTKRNLHYVELPLQQKVLFASALALATSGLKLFSREKLFDKYRRICSLTHVPAVDSSESGNLCDLLESNGLLRRSIKSGQNCMYILAVDETIAREVIDDDRLLSVLLADKI